MQSNHKHVPSFFDPKQILPSDARQQSVSSFTNNKSPHPLDEWGKTEDSTRYFVNALGQRISSTVMEMNPMEDQ